MWSVPSRPCVNWMSTQAAFVATAASFTNRSAEAIWLSSSCNPCDFITRNSCSITQRRWYHPTISHAPAASAIACVVSSRQCSGSYPLRWIDFPHIDQPQPYGGRQAAVAFVLRATDLHRTVPQFYHRDALGHARVRAPAVLCLRRPATGNVARGGEQRAARQPAGGPSSPGPACGSLRSGTVRPTGVDVGLAVGDDRHHLGRLQHLIWPAVRCRSNAPTPVLPAVAGDAGSGLPRRGSRHRRRPGQDTIRSGRPPRSLRAPARRMRFPSRPGRGRGDVAPWLGTSPHFGPVLPGRAARHRPRRSDRTSPQPALPTSLSGWRKTARPAAHPCGRLRADAGTPFYAKTSVRGFAPPFIEAHITECPERQFHNGSCWSVAAGQRIVLAPRRTSEKFRKLPNATLHVCIP